jgi:hypothetical protein
LYEAKICAWSFTNSTSDPLDAVALDEELVAVVYGFDGKRGHVVADAK